MLVLADFLALVGVLPGQDWPAYLIGKTEGFEQMWEFIYHVSAIRGYNKKSSPPPQTKWFCVVQLTALVRIKILKLYFSFVFTRRSHATLGLFLLHLNEITVQILGEVSLGNLCLFAY